MSAPMYSQYANEYAKTITHNVYNAFGLLHGQDTSYGLIVCPLTIYIEDLNPLFNDVRRALIPGGSFFFLTHHPIVDFAASPSGNYFSRELIVEEWDTIGHQVQVQFYRHSLTGLFTIIANAGLHVANLNEGRPTAAMKDVRSA